MARVKRIFVDTSVLVAGMIDLGEDSVAPLAVLDAVAAGHFTDPRTAWHCCLEFFSVTTRLPEEYRLDPETSLRFVEEEILERFSVDDLPPENRLGLLTAAVGDGVAGGRIYDAHIAEIARLVGTQVVITENRRHFTGLLRHDIRVLSSAELVAEL